MSEHSTLNRCRPGVLPLAVLLLAFAVGCATAPAEVDDPPPAPPVAALPPLPQAETPTEGTLLRGSDPRMLLFRAFLDRAGIPASFGTDGAGLFVLSVARDATDVFLLIPYAWEHIDYAQWVILSPDDRARAETAFGIPAETELRLAGWKKAYARTVVGRDPRITFKRSVLNLPFGEETLAAFFYSLRDSIRRPGSLAALYHPAFSGTPVTVRVNLFSVEILLDDPVLLSPEGLFLWFYTLNTPTDRYDDRFYLNLLALKIAKRLYTGLPSFLGGATLFTHSGEIPFDQMRKSLFSNGTVETTGFSFPYSYVWNGELFTETTGILPIDRAEPVQAFYATAEGADRALCTIVLRAADAEEKRDAVETLLGTKGFTPVLRLHERTGEQDGWAALGFAVPAAKENAIMRIFETELAKIDRTISIGVYRVGTQER